MNARQAARAAAKRIEDMEITMARMMRDIKRYNQVIDAMIAGGDPCDYCEDCNECHLSDHGKGCKLWMLSYEEDDNHGYTVIDGGAADGTCGGSGGAGTGGAEVPEGADGD